MRDAYLAHGFDGEPSHRLLELLLFFGIPYRDTNEIAHRLINHFGSFSGVLSASAEQLARIKGMTQNAAILLTMILPLYRRYEDDLLNGRPKIESTEALVRFIRPRFLGVQKELLFLLCFDDNSRLIAARKLSEGDLNTTTMDYRAMTAVALETNATHVVLVHNHPGGVAAPSASDVAVTRNARLILAALKVTLDDHIILAQDNYFSMTASPRFSGVFFEGE